MLAAWRQQLSERFENWVTSRHRPVAGPITIRRGRLYILPTRPGYLFAFMLFGMLLGAMNYNNNLAFALTFLLGGMGMVCMHVTNANLLGLKVTVPAIPPVFSGDPVLVPVHLTNPSAQDRHSLMVAHKRAQLRHEAGDDCLANSDAQLHLSLNPRARGIYRLPRFAIATEFPLGLFQAWSWLSLEREFLVYPRPSVDERPVPPCPDMHGDRAGHQAGSEDFAGLRAYRPGDSLRSIHWKSYSHAGQLSSKLFSDPMDESLWLDWDSLPDLRDPELRLSQLCRWVLDCDARQQPYGLRLPGVRIPPDQGAGHRKRCLEQLARHEAGR